MGNLSALRLPDPDIFVCLLLSYLLHGKRYALISGASGRQGKGLMTDLFPLQTHWR